MKLRLRLTGTKPMLMHNSRLANPVDTYTVQLKELTGKRKKTLEDHARIMHLEARGGIYETEDGLVALPTQNVWRSIQDGAKMVKLGKHCERGLFQVSETPPLLIDGATVSVKDFLDDPANIDYRTARNQKNTIMRARPIIPAGWQSDHELEFLEDVFDKSNFAPIFELCGRLVGVGDWRPRYGTYEVAILD